MDIVSILVRLIIILAILAIAWAVIRRLALPPFAMTVLYVVAGVIAILYLASFLGHTPHFRLGH